MISSLIPLVQGIAGCQFGDRLVVPIIENTPFESQLTDSLEQAIKDYPDTHAVLVRRHGIYVWGKTWEQAKTMAECYHYLFQLAVDMHSAGLDPTVVPSGYVGTYVRSKLAAPAHSQHGWARWNIPRASSHSYSRRAGA